MNRIMVITAAAITTSFVAGYLIGSIPAPVQRIIAEAPPGVCPPGSLGVYVFDVGQSKATINRTTGTLHCARVK